MTTTDAQGNLHDGAGQFAGRMNTPPSTTLEEPLWPEPPGSFMFPPPEFHGTDELLRFFETQPISDRLLSNLQYAFSEWRNRNIIEAVNAEFGAWAELPATKKAAERGGTSLEAVERQAIDYLDRLRAAEEAKWPVKTLANTDARSAAIAYRMWEYRYAIEGVPDKEATAKELMEYPLPNHNGLVPAREFIDYYRMTEWAQEAFTDSDLPMLYATRRAAQHQDKSILSEWVRNF